MNMTLSHFKQMIPTNKEPSEWYSIAAEFFPKYDITTANRIAAFMAQTAHESTDFRVLEENLNYSEERLLAVFSRYFGKGKRSAREYARNPEKLANYVYMDEFRSKSGALGNTQPGDGWRFRGGGIKQLTGRNNFTAFGRDIGMTAEQAADYVRTKRGAFESACWFWKKNGLARFADADDIDGMSRKVNGGTIGLEDRRTRYRRAKAILSGVTTFDFEDAVSPIKNSHDLKPKEVEQPIFEEKTCEPSILQTVVTVKRNSRGDLVKKVQEALKIHADGIFGLQTEIAVRSWQRSNKYIANGILDGKQLEKLLGE